MSHKSQERETNPQYCLMKAAFAPAYLGLSRLITRW